MSDDHPDHLPAGGPDRRQSDPEEFRERLDRVSTTAKRRRLLESETCPQPYDRSPTTVEAWEGSFVVADCRLEPTLPGYELRKEGTTHDDGKWIRSTIRYHRLDDLV